MMLPDLQRILRIRDYCLEIQKTISRYGNDFQIFDSDGDYQRSIAFSILQIGELGGSLSEAYRKETCNRIQWGPIKGMRNMVDDQNIHVYRLLVLWGKPCGFPKNHVK